MVADLVALRDIGVTDVEFHPDGEIAHVGFSVMPKERPKKTDDEQAEEEKAKRSKKRDALELAEELVAARR